MERYVVGRSPCACPLPALAEGVCSICGGHVCYALWHDSETAAAYLRGWVCQWRFPERKRFLGFLGDVLARRLQVGKIQPEQYILIATPEDIARAAVMAKLEG